MILLFPTLPQSIGLGRLQRIRSSASTLGIQLRVLNHSPKSPPPLQTLPLVVFCLLFLTIPRLPELRMPSTAPKPVVTASIFLNYARQLQLPRLKMRAELLRFTDYCTFTGSCPQQSHHRSMKASGNEECTQESVDTKRHRPEV